MNNKKAVLISIGIATCLLMFGCTNNPVRIYNDAKLKTNTIQSDKRTVDVKTETVLNISRKTKSIIVQQTEDFKNNLAEGTISVTGDNPSKRDIYRIGSYTYIIGADGDYIKSITKGNPFGAQAFSDYALQVLKNDNASNNSMMVKDKATGNKVITFTVPSDQCKTIIQETVKSTMNSSEVKDTAVNQAVQQMKKQFSGQNISEAEIVKIVNQQMEEVSKAIDVLFEGLSFGDLTYTATIDKQGFIIDEVYKLSITNKDNKITNLVVEQKLTDINSNISLKPYKLDSSKSVISENFMDVYLEE